MNELELNYRDMLDGGRESGSCVMLFHQVYNSTHCSAPYQISASEDRASHMLQTHLSPDDPLPDLY